MKFSSSAILLALAATADAFVAPSAPGRTPPTSSFSLRSTDAATEPTTELDNAVISNLKFRAIQRELKSRDAETSGMTLTEMKDQLRMLAIPECATDPSSIDCGIGSDDDDGVTQVSRVKSFLFFA